MQKVGSEAVGGEACTVLVQVKLHPATVRLLSGLQVAYGQGFGELLEIAVDAVRGRWCFDVLRRHRMGDLPEGFDIGAFGVKSDMSSRAARRAAEQRLKRAVGRLQR